MDARVQASSNVASEIFTPTFLKISAICEDEGEECQYQKPISLKHKLELWDLSMFYLLCNCAEATLQQWQTLMTSLKKELIMKQTGEGGEAQSTFP